MGKKEKTSEKTERDEKVRTTRVKVQSCTEYRQRSKDMTIHISNDILITSFLFLKLFFQKYKAPTLYRSLIIVIFIRDWTVHFYICIYRKQGVHGTYTRDTKEKNM